MTGKVDAVELVCNYAQFWKMNPNDVLKTPHRRFLSFLTYMNKVNEKEEKKLSAIKGNKK